MTTNARAMVFASFAADALALGAHWIYDVDLIDRSLGRVSDFRAPQPPTYHPTKRRGDFTHYGDQTLVLLRCLAERGGFEEGDFSRAWRKLFTGYSGYVDGATRQTLQQIDAGTPPGQAGSASQDLAGAARIAPLVYRYRDDLDRLVAAARRQTALTHNSPLVIDSAEFFARAACHLLGGAPAVEALSRSAAKSPAGGPIPEWVDSGLRSAASDTRPAIHAFGQMCAVEAAFPAAIHLIAKYETRLEEGLIENVMAGGDSAGRGLVVGMLLGARCGMQAIPRRWLEALTARATIEELLIRIGQPASIRPDGGERSA
ncbi:MAG: ADP-ribosylglycohydrolase family protein [Desulfobacterales bacterium]|jgi:ADP-ribosylglycohydrolase|nr:ADP-ribosylglycohydrolase family protein [Desulfobacterales bacterium]